MNFKKYKEWFTLVFGSEATKVFLDDKNECIGRDEKSLRDFFKKYQRIEPIKNIKMAILLKDVMSAYLKVLSLGGKTLLIFRQTQ